MAKPKTRTPAIVAPVPQSDADAEQMIARLGALELDWKSAEAVHQAQIDECARKVADLKEAFAPREAAFLATKKLIGDGLSVYATANRQRLTNGGRTKTVQFATGKVFWKEGLPSINWGKLKHAEVVERVEARIREIDADIAAERRRAAKADLRRDRDLIATFLAITVKPSKDAMGEHPALAITIPGVAFSEPGEGFFVEPLALQISEVA